MKAQLAQMLPDQQREDFSNTSVAPGGIARRQHLKHSSTMDTDLAIAYSYFPNDLIPEDTAYAQHLIVWTEIGEFQDNVNASSKKSLIITILVPAEEWAFTNFITSKDVSLADGVFIAGTISNWTLPFRAQSPATPREVNSVFLLFSREEFKDYSEELYLSSDRYVHFRLQWGRDGGQAHPNVTYEGMPDDEEDDEEERSTSSHSHSEVPIGDAEEYALEDARIADMVGLSTPDLEVFSCNFKEITVLVSSTAIRLNSKILSVGFHLFPWIRPWMRRKFLVAKYSDATRVYTTLKSAENVAKSRLATEDYIWHPAFEILGRNHQKCKQGLAAMH